MKKLLLSLLVLGSFSAFSHTSSNHGQTPSINKTMKLLKEGRIEGCSYKLADEYHQVYVHGAFKGNYKSVTKFVSYINTLVEQGVCSSLDYRIGLRTNEIIKMLENNEIEGCQMTRNINNGYTRYFQLYEHGLFKGNYSNAREISRAVQSRLLNGICEYKI